MTFRRAPSNRRVVSRRVIGPAPKTVHVEGGSRGHGLDAVTGQPPRPRDDVDPEIAAIDATRPGWNNLKDIYGYGPGR